MTTNPGAWSDDRVGQLKLRWAQGWSASQVAKELNKLPGPPVSRNGVIGKVHRLRLPERAAASTPKKGAVMAPAKSRFLNKVEPHRTRAIPKLPPKPVSDARPPSEPLETHDRPRPELVDTSCTCSMDELTAKRCKWPIGDPATESFAYCGRDKPAEGGPYCAGHQEIAYVPPKYANTPKELARSLRRYA